MRLEVAGRTVNGAWIDVAVILTGRMPPPHLLRHIQLMSDWLRSIRGSSAIYNILGTYAFQMNDMTFEVVCSFQLQCILCTGFNPPPFCVILPLHPMLL